MCVWQQRIRNPLVLPKFATEFLPWTTFTALIGIGIILVFAYGIGVQLILWA
jgi:membrane-anchored glycerophosphoryl diester phosphodiesterase (GDPDase)